MLKKLTKVLVKSAVCAVILSLPLMSINAGGHPDYLRVPLGTEVPTLDPGVAEDNKAIEVIEQLFSGLTTYDAKTYEVKPNLATSWKATNGGKTYTFKMREDAKWTNGDPVTAHDIVYAIRRNIKPETASPYAFVLYILRNAEDINKGKIKDVKKIGVKALNKYTVQFQLNSPAAFFPSIAGMWTLRPLHKKTIEKHGTRWTDVKNIVTCGSYNLETWSRGNLLILKKNPMFFDSNKTRINEIRYLIVREPSTALAMYENNELDLIGIEHQAIPPPEIPRVKKDPVLSKEYSIYPRFGTYYLGFNNERPPVDNPLIRKAISAAIDRKTIIDRVVRGDQTPATTFTSPPVFGAVDPAERVGIRYDPEQARKWLAEAGYPNGKGMPEIIYMHNTLELHAQVAQAVQAMLKRNLNINVRIQNQEWKVYLKSTMQPDTPHMFRYGWGADYPDAHNFLSEVFHPTKSINRIRWKNKEFATLMDKAVKSTDQKARKEMYRRAEQILCEEEAAIAPIYFDTAQYLSKPYLKWNFIALGGQHVREWYFTDK